MKIGDIIKVEDSDLGMVEGKIVSFNHEGYPMVEFQERPAIVIFTSMILK